MYLSLAHIQLYHILSGLMDMLVEVLVSVYLCCYICIINHFIHPMLMIHHFSQVTAEDPDIDANGDVKYFIEFGNSNGYFSIEEDTGEITLAKNIPLVENRVLEFPLHVTARDGRSYLCIC